MLRARARYRCCSLALQAAPQERLWLEAEAAGCRLTACSRASRGESSPLPAAPGPSACTATLNLVQAFLGAGEVLAT